MTRIYLIALLCIKHLKLNIMKTLELTQSEINILKSALIVDRDNTIAERADVSVHNEELLEYYDTVIDRTNDLINRLEDLN